jgi:CheY-like chemotaxis protein
LIIVDINLPRIDGHEVVRAIRNSPHLNKLLVAVLTTSENPDERAKVMAQKATLVTKPASVENLCELLETLEIDCLNSAVNKKRLEVEQAQELVEPEWSNILLLEDNYADRLLFREFIDESRAPGEVYEAANLTAALDTLKERKMDLILADLGLPDAKGLEVLSQLNSASRGTPIVILTGNDDEELAIEAVSKGAQDYLVKGEVTSRSLVRAMRYAITRKRAEDLALRAVASENELLQEILESAPLSMARFTPQLSISAYNSSFAQSFNRTIKSIVGHSIKDIIRIPDYSLWAAVIYDGAPFRVENFQMRDQFDQERNWDITVWPNRSQSTMARGGLFIAMDITERVKLERQREEFVASLAHDIRNPLIGAERLLSFVDDPNLSKERREETLEALRKSNSELLEMLQSLLENFRKNCKI